MPRGKGCDEVRVKGKSGHRGRAGPKGERGGTRGKGRGRGGGGDAPRSVKHQSCPLRHTTQGRSTGYSYHVTHSSLSRQVALGVAGTGSLLGATGSPQSQGDYDVGRSQDSLLIGRRFSESESNSQPNLVDKVSPSFFVSSVLSLLLSVDLTAEM